ncbi:hypothetical protein [Mollivirus kamchatka]|nr:hypothetical protein [Mollivirus kamchatka]
MSSAKSTVSSWSRSSVKIPLSMLLIRPVISCFRFDKQTKETGTLFGSSSNAPKNRVGQDDNAWTEKQTLLYLALARSVAVPNVASQCTTRKLSQCLLSKATLGHGLPSTRRSLGRSVCTGIDPRRSALGLDPR